MPNPHPSLGAHTPGPWTREIERVRQGLHGSVIATVNGGENWLANARLIAAAPELLAFVQECATYPDARGNIARALLDRIDGKENAR